MLPLIGVVVSPGATVPVCCDEDSVRGFGIHACLYVAAWHGQPVESGHGGLQLADLGAEGLELSHNPVATRLVGCTTGYTRSECTLCLNVCEGGISPELGSLSQGYGVGVACPLSLSDA